MKPPPKRRMKLDEPPGQRRRHDAFNEAASEEADETPQLRYRWAGAAAFNEAASEEADETRVLDKIRGKFDRLQ